MRRSVAAVVSVLILALLWWILTPPERRMVRPSQTMRALKAKLTRKLPARPPPQPEPPPVVVEEPLDDRVLTHRVDLEDGWTATMRSMDEWFVQTLPQSYWPHLDEVDWPENASVDRLQALLDDEIETRIRDTAPFFGSEPTVEFLEANEQLVEVLDLAEDEGLLAEIPIWERPPTDDTDPWELLHQAQLHRAAELHAYLHSEGEVGLRQGQMEEQYGLPEASWLAGHIADQNPDHPAADFARLMLLETAQWQLSKEDTNPQPVVDDVVDAITKTDDPMVKETALIGLLSLNADALEGANTADLLEVVEEELHTLTPEMQDALSAQALEIAIRTSPDKIDTWLDQLGKADTDGEEPVIGPEQLDRVWDDLAGRGLREPNSWSSELHANAWSCHRKHAVPAPRDIDVTAVWQEGWVWELPMTTGHGSEPLELPPAWWACFESSTWTHKPPAKNLRLNVQNLPFPTD